MQWKSHYERDSPQMPHHSQSRFALSEVFTSCGIGLLPILAKSSLQVYKRMELFVVKFSVMVL